MINFRIKVFISLISILTTACNISSSDPHQVELQAVYERSRIIITEARKDFDTLYLSEVFTQDAIDTIEKELVVEKEMARENPISGGEEIEVDWVEVVEYTPPKAIIKVKYFYRSYTYNRETGEIIYYDKPYRYWRIFKYRMLQEDGVWKVDEALEFVDWSG